MTEDIRGRLKLSEVISKKIKPFCEPLGNILGVHTFGYRKFFSDGTSFNTSSNFDWTKLANEKFSNIIVPNYEKEVSSSLKDEKRYFLRIGEPDHQDIHVTMLYDFNVWNTLSIYKRELDGLDVFYFASTRENYKVVSNYFNNLTLLENFSDYFKDKIYDIISPQDMKRESSLTISPKVFQEHNSKVGIDGR